MKHQKYLPETKNRYATTRFNQLGKMCFSKAALTLEQAKDKSEEWGQRYYLCPQCDAYHMTKKV